MPVEHELLTQIQQLKNEKNRLVDLLEKERAEKIKKRLQISFRLVGAP